MRRSDSSRRQEAGGITILLALVLLSMLGAMVFGLGRDSLREIAITGNESLGRKAAEAADSGIDWTVTWGLSNGATADQQAVYTAINQLSLAIADPTLRTLGTDATTNTKGTGYMSDSGTGILRAYIYPSTPGSDLSPSTSGYTQQSVVTQAMETEVRYLGPYPLANTGALTAGKSSGGGATGSKRFFFLVRSTGRANVGDTGQSFAARRDAIVDITF
ncbi:hypothetical protein [Geothrix campi]|jgi:hypothetical protein|uniref:hypothetical protein n=1 Tax=Geothrix campi TaxID=2966450 RepID=UPI0021487532|nr:hypothetical protein [Geothrix sp. SG10]